MTSSRRSNRDHAKKQNQPGVADEVVEAQLEALLTPALFNQSLYYRQLGLRNRLLNLPLMMAAVLTLLWRNVPGVRELTPGTFRQVLNLRAQNLNEFGHVMAQH